MITINAVPILIAVLCIYAIAYRYYSAFIAAKWCPHKTYLFVGT